MNADTIKLMAAAGLGAAVGFALHRAKGTTAEDNLQLKQTEATKMETTQREAGERLKGERLKGQVAIVTGASSGIGLAVCQALQSEGCTVIMAARNLSRLETAAKEVPGAVLKTIDVVDRNAVHAMVKQVRSEQKRVDILVNCAGVMYFTMMKNLHYDEWQQQIDINCSGLVNACGADLPGMLEAKTGHIVNISSDAAKAVFPALSVYNASKAFVAMFSKGLRASA